jgi:F-type H+-transporting ATPase subunit b
MELNATTFFLEIINFLALVWLLTRFFYRPVLSAIEKRRQALASDVAEARQAREEAQQLELLYKNRLADWEQERTRARDDLRVELQGERQRALDKQRLLLVDESAKARVVLARENEKTVRELHHQAIEQGLLFVTRTLERVANPELERTLIKLALEELAGLPPLDLEQLRQARSHNGALAVATAFPLSEGEQHTVLDELQRILGPGASVVETHPELRAGIRVTLGSWVLSGTLKDELELFARAGQNE